MDGFDWAKDLQRLVGDAVQGIYQSENTPFNEIAQGNVVGAIGSPITAFGNAMAIPSDFMKSQVGGVLFAPTHLRNALGLGDLGTMHEENVFNAANENSNDPNAGGRAIWEMKNAGIQQSDRLGVLKTPIQAAIELGVDPATWLGVGVGEKAAAAAGKAVDAGMAGEQAIKTMQGANQTLDLLFNKAPYKVTSAALSPVGKVAKRVIPKRMLELDPRSRLQREVQDVGMAFNEKLDSQQRMPGKFLPAVMGQTNPGKSIAPIEKYTVPPFFANQFDSGVSEVVKQRAWEAYQRMKMSQPDIPGINAPGWTPAQQGQATFFQGQRPGPGGGLLGRLRSSTQAGPLGFVNIPGGGYKTPMDVRIDEDNLHDMAEIGLAAVLDYDNHRANGLFGQLLRVSEGNNSARRAVIQKYGAGVEPMLPLVHEEMQKLANQRGLGVSLGSSRFITPWGFTEGLDKVETATLKRIQDNIAAGTMTEDQALAYLRQRGMSKASPQVTEHAANMGAGFLASIRRMEDNPADFGAAFHGFTGEMRPQPFSAASNVDPATGRAVVPEAFNNYVNRTIDNNREAYNTYMRQTFGNLSDPELETLRQMSVESLYDAMIEAASPVTGADQGATTLLKRGSDLSRYPNDEAYQKIGVAGGPGSYGTRSAEITPDFPEANTLVIRGKKFNDREFAKHYGDRRVSAALFREVFGDRPSAQRFKDINGGKGLSPNQQRDMLIEAAGGTVWTDNDKEAVLPNTQRLIDHFRNGRNIPVGDQGAVAEKWYSDAVDEVMNIVGPGNYEDAHALIEFIAITSSGTDVSLNGRNALRAYAEWKLGSDEFLRTRLNLTRDDVDRLLDNRLGDSEDPLNLFRDQMAASQKEKIGEAMTELNRRMETNAHGSPFAPLQGGPKTNNFAGSFILKLWNRSMDYALADNPQLRDRVKEALDKAATIYTVDRHDSRIFGGATAVNTPQSIREREQGILAAKVADIRPEDFQAGLWYWSKQQQGFVPQRRTDDLAGTLRRAWNDRIDNINATEPGKIASIREQIKADNPGISEADLMNQAEDMMRQEVVYAMISDTLKGKAADVERRIGRNPLQFLQNSGDDMMGIIHRGMVGGDNQFTRPSTHIPLMVNNAEKELENINKGLSEGSTFAWDETKHRFAPASDTGGYAVALTSAGRTVSTKTRKTSAKTINQFMAQYGDLLDDPGIREHLRFGLFKMGPGEASFDLTVIVPDEKTAIQLGRRANQHSIYDIAKGDIIETGGDGTPVITKVGDIKDTIEGIFGKQIQQKRSLHDVLHNGVTVDELDSVNPHSILQRKVVQPLMAKFREASLADLKTKTRPPQSGTPLPEPPGGLAVPSPVDDSPFDFASIGHDPLISTQANQILGQTFDNGESYGARAEKYHNEATADLQRIQQSGVKWGPDATLKERLEAAKHDPTVQEIIKKYDKEGIDPLFGNAQQVAMARVRKDLAAKHGIEPDRNTTWDLIRAAWGEQALFSPKYHMGNIQGAWLANAFGGTFRAGTPREFLAAFKLARGGLDNPGRHEVLNQLHAYQVAQKWGFDDLPSYLRLGGVRDMVSNRTRISSSAMGELTGRVTGNKALGQAVGRPFVMNAYAGDAVEMVMRGSLWSDVLDREMTRAMPEVEDSLKRMAQKQGLDEFEFSAVNGINQLPGGTGSGKLKDYLIEQGFSEGYAERGARNYAEARNAAERAAKAEVEKRQFSYERTNLDNFISKFVPFHYYMSRAVRYYGEEALRHPYTILNYMRANDFIDDAQNDPGLDARQKGFLRLMGTPLGFTLLMNPDALFGVVKVFNLDDDYDTSGQPKMGQVISWLKNRGMGLYPWLDGTMNLMGMYGDTFEPDLLGIRHKSLIGAAVNFMRANLGMDPGQAFYQSAMGQARYNISSFVSQFTPDWLTQPVLPKAGGNTTDATMDQLIESRVVANNPRLSNGQLLDIMSNPDSPEYTDAYRQVADAGLAQQLLNFTLPQNFRMREASRDVRNAQVKTIADAARIQGVSPFEFKPTVGDVQFATTYRNLTGKDWKPGDYATANTKQDLVAATPEERPFVYQEAEYNNLGTDEDRRVFKKYTDIKYGTDPQTAGLDPDTQRIIADQWADQYGYRQRINYIYDLQNAFEATHPEFAQFKGWQQQMFFLRDHLGGDLGEYRRQASQQNPNAARYFSDQERWIKQTFPEDQWPAQIDRGTTSMRAFLSVNGIPQAVFDSAPQPGVPAVDYTAPNMVQSLMNQSSGGYDWQGGLNQYRQWMGGLDPQQSWG